MYQDRVRFYNSIFNEIYEHKIHDFEDERSLWVGVLDRALLDVSQDISKIEDRRDALKWFMSQDDDVGSFIWVMSLLFPDKYSYIKKLRKKIENIVEKDDEEEN